MGFKVDVFLTQSNYKINPIGIISLKRAVKSFYSTYEGLHRHYVVRSTSDECNQYYPDSFYENYVDCIIFFQHFFEITIKDLLAHDSELLVTTYRYKDSITPLYNLIHNIPTDTDNVNSVEFSDALDRIEALVNKIYPDGSFDFLKKYKKELRELNTLRNKVIHRGRYILNFEELDSFIGKSIFPIINEIFMHPFYNNLTTKWKHKPLSCGIDPFQEILNECKNPVINHRKIALLKELGRAAYNRPYRNISWGIYIDKQKKLIEQKILSDAQFETSIPEEYLLNYLDECPVCGEMSLMSFNDSTDDYCEDEETGEQFITAHYDWIAGVKCIWCSYELDCAYIGDISSFGLNGLTNYFV